MNQNPTVKISPETKEELDKSKMVDCETYDSVISRLIKLDQTQKKLTV